MAERKMNPPIPGHDWGGGPMAERKMNPPIPGHELISEGHTWRGWGDYDSGWHGGCRCGARPEGFPHVSMNAMKKWHREHKAELRAAADA